MIQHIISDIPKCFVQHYPLKEYQGFFREVMNKDPLGESHQAVVECDDVFRSYVFMLGCLILRRLDQVEYHNNLCAVMLLKVQLCLIAQTVDV